MEIIFATKEENNQRREKEFLALSYAERLEKFFIMLDENEFIGEDKSHPNDKKDNLILKCKNDS
ncbi:MAG: hypothetical protein WCY25_07795 [Moheibacter sp.]